ncbi:MAG: GIY-YIG nuclease family protein [Flavobacteriaceae bacterium]|nr:GIY-YIG nuclease family protein [Flavobacteriaceae bacterium]
MDYFKQCVRDKLIKNVDLGSIDDPCGKYFLYLITERNYEVGDYLKVGFTRNLKNRITMLQTGNPRNLGYALVMSAPSRKIVRNLEKGFKDYFKNQLVKNEWFKINKEIVELIREVV